MKIKLVILFLGIICSSCSRITPSGFWLNYKSELITEKKNDQGPWGGTLYINWSADKNTEFNIKKITELASQNGWKLIDSTNYNKVDLINMSDFGKPTINLPLKNFTPESTEANLKSESFPRFIETDFKLYRFKTKWLIFEPGTDNSTQDNGFVLLSSDNKRMTVYQLWGE
ncbi:hypothetical protein K8089_16125 [Aequorivita sp. F47161]|uniref:Lipoprotein n=1 Tax=Aequorivita vitellina TaxID=2874475 RepID=A0A9X1QXH8_9FLAO|nr:hypothetical protein [Aequorivita vitellina]MCG2420550.1 hypothetical protein [Aequorivita vitellina]